MARARRGDLASALEIALVADVPQQTVNRWLREEEIDLGAMRLKYLAKLTQEGQAYLATLSGAPRVSADQRRRDTLKAVRKLNERQAKRHTQSGRAVALATQAEDGEQD